MRSTVPQRAVIAAAQEAALERAAKAERATPVRDAAVARVVERLAMTDGPSGAGRRVHGTEPIGRRMRPGHQR
jgi:hypothetical protein